MPIVDKTVLITGGTGSFGKKLIQILLAEHRPHKVIVFSRDELKQFEMAADPKFTAHGEVLRFFIGDVRDKDRLARAFDGVNYVIHAAALKQVPAAEYNPFEAVKTNVLGAQNVIDCAIDKGVERTVALSTDKATNPVNLYGATKLCSDKLFIGGNLYAGAKNTRFSVVRYGNVVGSRGSVIPLFLRQRKHGALSITDKRMTRFWITLEQGARFVLESLESTRGAELFIPKIPSMRVTDLATAISPETRHEYIGIRPGEKLHEVMIPEDDARHAVELVDRYVVLPFFRDYTRHDWDTQGKPCPDGFRYASDTNTEWLSIDDLRQMVAELDSPDAREWAFEMGLRATNAAGATSGRETFSEVARAEKWTSPTAASISSTRSRG
jgi:UDP-N-acetylglucosamine 4,6-dehydratase